MAFVTRFLCSRLKKSSLPHTPPPRQRQSLGTFCGPWSLSVYEVLLPSMMLHHAITGHTRILRSLFLINIHIRCHQHACQDWVGVGGRRKPSPQDWESVAISVFCSALLDGYGERLHNAILSFAFLDSFQKLSIAYSWRMISRFKGGKVTSLVGDSLWSKKQRKWLLRQWHDAPTICNHICNHSISRCPRRVLATLENVFSMGFLR